MQVLVRLNGHVCVHPCRDGVVLFDKDMKERERREERAPPLGEPFEPAHYVSLRPQKSAPCPFRLGIRYAFNSPLYVHVWYSQLGPPWIEPGRCGSRKRRKE